MIQSTDNPQPTILIVEDEPHTREVLAYILGKQHWRVLTAEDGEAGMRALSSGETIDLVICDVMMPVMDGFALREIMRRDPHTRDIPFIFLTARSQPDDQVRGLEMGVDDYITKPFEPAVLRARIGAVLERRRAFRDTLRCDGLTRLLNRATLETEIVRALERVQRFGENGSLVFMDLDDFKSVNDTHGHEVGDRVLEAFADLIRQHSRTIDIAGRYGGEEFVVYLPQTGMPGARTFAERLLRAFSARDFGVEGLRCTFSAGAAAAPEHALAFHDLCDRADKAMYHAKRTGKARFVPWSEAVIHQ